MQGRRVCAGEEGGAHLLLGTEATDHPVSPLIRVVLLAVMADVTGVGLATAGEPVHVEGYSRG